MFNFCKIKRFVAFLFLYGAIMSVANSGGFFGGHSVFQRIEIGNNGQQNVIKASVLYGQQQLIQGPARAKFQAGNVALNRYGQGLNSPIPEKTEIRWATDDGNMHEVSIPTRGLVQNADLFYGFRFYFMDAHVEVYLIERIPNPANTLDLRYIKVYSSP